MQANDRWWEQFYDDVFADTIMDTQGDAGGEDAVTAQAVDFLVQHLRLQEGDLVMDQGCGLGRVSLPLARRGFRAIGVDLAPTYAGRAQAVADAEGLSARFHQGDAFEWISPEPCDAAFNWWSSFGYTHVDADNIRMLRRASDSLKPGGRFALDYYSAPRLLREFRDAVTLTYRTRHGEFTVTRSADVDWLTGSIDQEWRYLGSDGREHRKRSRTKIYLPHELARLLEGAGFVVEQLLGGADGSPFTLASPRCVLVAVKPDA